MLAHDSLYHDQTVFDQLVSWTKQRFARALPGDREQRWGGFFLSFSLMLCGIAAYFLLSALFTESQTSAGAHVVSAVLMLFAVRFFMQTGQDLLTPAPAQQLAPRSPGVTHKKPPATADASPVQARHFFKAVRDAGINVKIARAIYVGGIKCAEDLNKKSDTELLAIRGVGPATVRKLRGHFNFVEEYYEV